MRQLPIAPWSANRAYSATAMRLFLILILCLAMPLHAWSARTTIKPCCPEAAMHDKALPTPVDAAQDCCDDADGSATDCPGGKSCCASTLWAATPLVQQLQPRVSAEHAKARPVLDADPPSPPDAVWRPPTSS